MSKLIENKKKRQQKCYKTTTDTTKKRQPTPFALLNLSKSCFTQFEQIQTDEQRWKWAKMRK